MFSAEERAQGYHIKFNVDSILRGDMAARAAFYSALYNTKSINPNEIRAKENMPPYAGGDQYGGATASSTAAN